MSATLEEVAKAAGVSVATASRVLTQSTHPVRAETRQRVLRFAQTMDYRPNLLARSMRTERTHTIGIIADDLLTQVVTYVKLSAKLSFCTQRVPGLFGEE